LKGKINNLVFIEFLNKFLLRLLDLDGSVLLQKNYRKLWVGNFHC
jgi:hypothetical protein